ncbi:hypothetical protein MLD38_010587 [Melastoma candidum]|uniref:Uncharacterized protein n=1 Tax=Melastoma candidum TaxID=119954 RepID=A0ACB9R0A8_9MYRT|nr:hypothetical protein MLD38_010587 [Melastoma candidum]
MTCSPVWQDGKETDAEKAVTGNPSMKTLIEEEIFAEQVCAKVCQKVIMLNGECDMHPDSGNPRVSDDKDKLSKTIGKFVNQQLAGRKHLGEDGANPFSKELVNMLQAPNLDEESFQKHLRQPSPRLVKYMRSLLDINVERAGFQIRNRS